MSSTLRSTGETVIQLLGEGYANATPGRLRHGILVGRIDRPQAGPTGIFLWDDTLVQQAREYLKNVPPRGRKPLAPRQEVQS